MQLLIAPLFYSNLNPLKCCDTADFSFQSFPAKIFLSKKSS
jgi:hypothetical protein